MSKEEMLKAEYEFEQRIKEAGANAPRLNPDLIKDKIIGTTYTMMPSEKSMVCEISLENGFTVRGDSSVVSKSNFRQDLGEDNSYKNAFDQIWGFEAYLLQEKLFQEAKIDIPSYLPDHMRRVFIERYHLTEKYVDLDNFIAGKSFETIVSDSDERQDLIDQRDLMKQYMIILDRRLERYQK